MLQRSHPRDITEIASLRSSPDPCPSVDTAARYDQNPILIMGETLLRWVIGKLTAQQGVKFQRRQRLDMAEPEPVSLLDLSDAIAYIVDIMADLLGAFEQAVLLAVWKLAEQAYGRAILRGTQAALDREAAAGAVYATLERLEQKGLLTSHVETGTPVRSGRARRYYRLTAVGARALNDSKSALEQMWRGAKWPLESKA
jgi:DNA-binding PadR family transcriptional regulator